jgi:D-sedoheptulose 7-phosphate isomerase
MSFFKEYFEIMKRSVENVDTQLLEAASNKIVKVHGSGGKIIIAGNGGSAAMAAHLAIDFTKAAKIRAICFNEASLITCYANDFGYEHWVEKALESYADEGDLLIIISSSGKSPNLLNAARQAKKMGLSTITFSGFVPDNPLKQLGDFNFWVDSKGYNIVEMTHHIWLVSIVDHIIGKIEYSA